VILCEAERLHGGPKNWRRISFGIGSALIGMRLRCIVLRLTWEQLEDWHVREWIDIVVRCRLADPSEKIVIEVCG
jgi:hypothetical protein